MQKETTSSQRVYYINCPNCGEIVKVVNPKLTKKPISVTQRAPGQSYSQVYEYVATKCAMCKKAMDVYFTYQG